jgi:L-amino acid N-acyltransferase YncA
MVDQLLQPNMKATVPLTTRDGRRVTVRHLRRNDAALLERMFYRLSSETRYRRFFIPLDNVDEERVHTEAQRLAKINPRKGAALVALAREGRHQEAIAVARFAVMPDVANCAEGSIVVRDDYQGSGLGGQLFDLLIQVALARGIRHLVLLTHADNHGMIALVQRLGLPYKGRFASGLYEIDLQLSDGERPYFPFSEPAE